MGFRGYLRSLDDPVHPQTTCTKTRGRFLPLSTPKYIEDRALLFAGVNHQPRHSVTASLFLLGIIFIPLVLIASRPFSAIGAAVGTGVSLAFITAGWIRLTKRP